MLTMLTMLTTPPRVRANAYHVLTTPPRVFREPKMCLRNIWTAPYFRISYSEWHPFTISSAPEVEEHFTLHIRGVGHWTNSLHTLFQDEFRCQELGGVRSHQAGTWQAAAGTKTSLQIKYFMSLSLD